MNDVEEDQTVLLAKAQDQGDNRPIPHFTEANARAALGRDAATES
jgi:hypothetical protein